MNEPHITDRFRELRKRAGYTSLDRLAKEMGYKGASSIQRYEDPNLFKGPFIKIALAEKLAAALVGKGKPAVTEAEVMELAGISRPLPQSNVGEIAELPDFVDSTATLPKDIPVLGIIVGGDEGDFSMNGTIVDYIRRPPTLKDVKDVFALYVSGESMSPWRRSGSSVLINPNRPARIGDYVMVELYPDVDDESPGRCLIKLLLKSTYTVVVLGQHNPPRDDIEIPKEQVRSIYPVIDYDDLLGI